MRRFAILFLGIGIGFFGVVYGIDFQLGALTEFFGIVVSVLIIEEYLRRQEEKRVREQHRPFMVQSVEEYNQNLKDIHYNLLEIYDKVKPHDENDITPIGENSPFVLELTSSLRKMTELADDYSQYLTPNLHLKLRNYVSQLKHNLLTLHSDKTAGFMLVFIEKIREDIEQFSNHLSETTNTPKYIYKSNTQSIIMEFLKDEERKKLE